MKDGAGKQIFLGISTALMSFLSATVVTHLATVASMTMNRSGIDAAWPYPLLPSERSAFMMQCALDEINTHIIFTTKTQQRSVLSHIIEYPSVSRLLSSYSHTAPPSAPKPGSHTLLPHQPTALSLQTSESRHLRLPPPQYIRPPPPITSRSLYPATWTPTTVPPRPSGG